MIDFQAALFDMDGTILDSMGVWANVDRMFFEKRGMAVPEGYQHAISGMSFRKTAEYTKETYALPESVDEILREWNEMCEREYAENVPLKPHAGEYLEKLSANGINLAVATALPEHLYKPALIRNNVYHLFSAFASTGESGETKATGRVYRAAADKMNVPYDQCAVFEDIYEGILGAKNAGMKTVLVRDKAAEHSREKSLALADASIETYAELL
ncbi:MAG: HAD family phosphatase [Clostridia bacterium]|nr:HAD family phosphatase [Clostridia bacterium]